MRISTLLILIYLFCNIGCSQPNHWKSANTLENLIPIVQLDKKIIETSALIKYDGSYWTINDSGDASYIYEINANNGGVKNKIEINKAKNKDWESLTTDDEFLYIGDIGNNSGDRGKLTIYKVKLIDLVKRKSKVEYDSKITFSYPDDRRNYDCEAMIIMDEQLWLFTKNRRGQDTHLYSLPTKEGHHIAEFKSKFQCNGLITAAAYKNKKLTLLGYTDSPHYLPFVWEFEKFTSKKLFKGKISGSLLPSFTI